MLRIERCLTINIGVSTKVPKRNDIATDYQINLLTKGRLTK